jgi:tetratricopeptide (TPR) repeat protein
MHFRFILLLLPLHPHAQGKPAEAGLPDSLSVLLRRAGSDSARIAANLRIASAMEASDFRKALEHATRAVQLSEKSGNYTLQIESNLAAGGVAMRKGLYDLAVIHFTRQYDLVRQAGDDLESSKAYFNLGAVHLMLGGVRQGTRHLHRGRPDDAAGLSVEGPSHTRLQRGYPVDDGHRA